MGISNAEFDVDAKANDDFDVNVDADSGGNEAESKLEVEFIREVAVNAEEADEPGGGDGSEGIGGFDIEDGPGGGVGTGGEQGSEGVGASGAEDASAGGGGTCSEDDGGSESEGSAVDELRFNDGRTAEGGTISGIGKVFEKVLNAGGGSALKLVLDVDIEIWLRVFEKVLNAGGGSALKLVLEINIEIWLNAGGEFDSGDVLVV